MIKRLPEATFSALVEDEVQGVTMEVHEIMLPFSDVKRFEKREQTPKTVSLGGIGELAVFSADNTQRYSGGLLAQGELLTADGELETSVNFFYPSLLERMAARIRFRQTQVQAAVSIKHY
jgi:hypothetical protein